MEYKNKFIFIAGPCVIESEAATLDTASYLKGLTAAYPDVFFVFKASFDKANRTSRDSYRGPGLSRGLKILEKVKRECNIPILSDVHCSRQVKAAAAVLDIIQIPAFLCRQTDLIVEAAKTGKVVNIKKGQFMAPGDMKYVVGKVKSSGNNKIMVTERGSSFGYNNLVVDFRSFLWLKKLGYPVIYDATHSLQRPSAAAGISGGDRQFIAPLARAAVACGVDGLFMEVHPEPGRALSDKHTVYPLGKVGALLKTVCEIRKAAL